MSIKMLETDLLTVVDPNVILQQLTTFDNNLMQPPCRQDPVDPGQQSTLFGCCKSHDCFQPIRVDQFSIECPCYTKNCARHRLFVPWSGLFRDPFELSTSYYRRDKILRVRAYLSGRLLEFFSNWNVVNKVETFYAFN